MKNHCMGIINRILNIKNYNTTIYNIYVCDMCMYTICVSIYICSQVYEDIYISYKFCFF